ncbi:MAG: hypothetical protein DSM106950_20905 [Stigonema ocellatum SAG 48.90 = DSM 106950]|nr:hypothetical protein [Stigonema ocellatum SAG 48.90 = DSM 106950]
MTNEKPTIAPETLKVLVEQTKLTFKPSELEQLSQTYAALERLKALVRNSRDQNRELAHTFDLTRAGS